jgi:hypothetical protein
VAGVVWTAVVAFYAIWHNGTYSERLHFWADVIEWSVNGDPTTEVNVKQRRYALGDEQFIATAATAYPKFDLRDTLRRYEQDRTAHDRFRYGGIALLLGWLVPPCLLYLGCTAIARSRGKRAEAVRAPSPN